MALNKKLAYYSSENSFPLLVLFTSASTLLCCALPALFVTLGLGATFASLVSAAPQLVWLSEHKSLLFLCSGVMLVLGGYWQWRARNAPCPTDPQLREACMQARRWSFGFYIISLVIYLVGLFFAYVINFL